MDFTWISTFALESLTKRNIGSHLARWTGQALEELVPGHGDATGPSRDRQGAQAAPCDGEFFHGVLLVFSRCSPPANVPFQSISTCFNHC